MQGMAWAGATCAGLWIGFGVLDIVHAADISAQNPAAAVQIAPGEQVGPAPTSRLLEPGPVPASAPQRVGWQTLTRSLEDRVIEYAQFGQGERQTLVVAPLAGDEIEGMELAERLANHLAQFPRSLNATTVTIVRDPNPDGRRRRTAGNARSVLLDQNFPTRYWRRMPSGNRWLSGREPESEPETRALIDLLEDLKPHRIIILGSSRRPPSLHYAGAAEGLAGQFSNLAHVRPLPLNPSEAAGSFAIFAGQDRGIPTLVLRVTARSNADQNWAHLKRALTAVLDDQDEPDVLKDISAAASSGTTSGGLEQPGRLATAATPVALQTRSGDVAPITAPIAPTIAPRVLSAEELEQDAPLVSVGRPPERKESELGVSEPGAARGAPAFPSLAPPAKAEAAMPAGLPPAQPHLQPTDLKTQSPNPAVWPRPAPPASQGGWKAKPPTRPSRGALYVPQLNKTAPSSPAAATPPADPIGAAPQAPAAGSRLERLPAVDAASPPLRNLKQEPIPFYPDTGY